MSTSKSIVVLLVEDDPGDQKLISKALANQEPANELYVAQTAEEALEYLQRSKNKDEQYPWPNLILLDLNMPGMGGKQLLKRLKADEQLSTIPVVILTTSDSDCDIIESYRLKACGYIKKPESLQELEEIIGKLSKCWFVTSERAGDDSGHRNKKNTCIAS